MSNGNVTVLTEENGIQREYRQVARKAEVGERILVVNTVGADSYRNGDILTVVEVPRWKHTVGSVTVSEIFDGLYMREYAVLEPTDVVVIGSQRWQTVQRKAAMGERVLVIADNDSGHDLALGSVHKITQTIVGSFEVKADRSDSFGYMKRADYVVLEPFPSAPIPQTSPSTDELLTLISTLAANHAALDKRVTTMYTDLRVAREDIVLIEEGVSDQFKSVEDRVKALESAQNPVIIKSVKVPELTRQDVIDRAKADVADRFTEGNEGVGQVVWGIAGHNKVEFVVNFEKRTVVALLRLAYGGKIVRATGKSRCTSDDVFNAHIGKAIGLRRALGLTVPTEYTNAPQPTSLKPGDIISTGAGRTYTVTMHHAAGTFPEKILDDSRLPEAA